MTKNLIPVKSNEFGELSILIEDGKELFPAGEMAKMLGYANDRKAIDDHCRYVTKRDVPHPQSPSKKITKNFIPESDVWRLIVRSSLPEANRIEKWIFEEVLPSIRKTGSYSNKPELNVKALPSVNHAVSLLHKTFKIAGGNPVSLGNMVVSLYRGIGVPVPALEAPVQSTYLSASQIADKLGIMSKSGKPHAQLVSGIIDQIDVPEELTQIMTFEQNGHSGTMIQYKPEVMILVEKYLYDSDFPLMFNLRDRNYQVQYRR